MFSLPNGPIRVLAVDDSAVMRGVMRRLFQAHEHDRRGDIPAMELCGVVEDGVECMAAVLRLRPDVVVLDLEMPRMHGLDVLKRLRMEEPSLPVIMCSSYTERGARSTLEALTLGAADYVTKPAQQSDAAAAIKTLAGQLLPRIAALAAARRMHRQELPAARPAVSYRAASNTPENPETSPRRGAQVEVVVIGVSTGGPSALEAMLPRLARDFPVPVLIVQHMPKLFTGALAERLDRCCALRVREAEDGAVLSPGTVWIAPGDAHMEIGAVGGFRGRDGRAGGMGTPVVRLHQQPSLNHCMPSVDFLFSSAARTYGAGTLAVVMTGMGSDGLAGARRVHERGGTVLTQDAASSAVWGMPGRVFEAGISRETLPLSALAGELTKRTGGKRSPRVAGGTFALPAPRHEEDAAGAARTEVLR